jgi:hypothetical protein
VTSHLFQQLSVLNIDLLPTKNDFGLAAVSKFFFVGSHDSRVVWIYQTNVSADVQSHWLPSIQEHEWRTVYGVLEALLIPHPHFHNTVE